MKTLAYVIILTIISTVTMKAKAQERSASSPSSSNQSTVELASPGRTAMQTAAKSGKYVFMFFWKEKNKKTDEAWETFQKAIARNTDWANSAAIQATDPAEKKLTEHFGLNRAPMPLVLAIAPNGAVTKAFTDLRYPPEFTTAWVSPGEQACLKHLQDRKLVFVCVNKAVTNGGKLGVPQGVKDFQSEKKYQPFTEVVTIDSDDKNEEAFLNKYLTNNETAQPVTLFLTPPGRLIGKFDSRATRNDIEANLVAVMSSPCGDGGGGKCGPRGCGQ